ncbi:hypothetical protein R1flu_025160 [Riccia fluitans]|uniref:Uncharacterized protein n=1 Tax=Riccia fluitans TaxID=41844 RepID=A0ABD1Y144_9MARC
MMDMMALFDLPYYSRRANKKRKTEVFFFTFGLEKGGKARRKEPIVNSWIFPLLKNVMHSVKYTHGKKKEIRENDSSEKVLTPHDI